MAKSVIQIRMPDALAEAIDELVKKGLYKNKSEVVIDAVRHFIGSEKKSGIAVLIEQQLKGQAGNTGCSREELNMLWDKVREDNEWKKRFGESPDDVMASLRSRR